MRLAKQKDVGRILEYLENDLGNCVYLYMDIRKYGLDSSYIKVWINEEEQLTTVVMRYFDSLQIYADKRNADMNGILELVLEEKVQMISGEKGLIDRLRRCEKVEEDYEAKEGYVFQLENYRVFPCEEIKNGLPEDCQEIADLMCMDEGFAGNYDAKNLALQLQERMQTGMGRSYVIKKNGKIIAHIATFAEDMGIAVTSGLIVHPKYRDYPYGTIMESNLVNILKKEGFKVFTFVNEQKRVKLLKAMGSKECGQYEKLMRKKR